MEKSTDELPKKDRLKNRGKVTKQRIATWLETFEDIIRDREKIPTTAVKETPGHKPERVTVKANKKTAWAIELFDPKTQVWKYAAFFNIDKSKGDPLIRFNHSIKWCMDRVKSEKDFFTHDTFDKSLCRIHNLITDDMVMAAVLI